MITTHFPISRECKSIYLSAIYSCGFIFSKSEFNKIERRPAVGVAKCVARNARGKYRRNFSPSAESSRFSSGTLALQFLRYICAVDSCYFHSKVGETVQRRRLSLRSSERIISRDTFPLETTAFTWDTSESYIRARPEVAHPLPLIRIEFITWCNFRSRK